eukprot:7752237-Pyramimonas_sp.AAC.1
MYSALVVAGRWRPALFLGLARDLMSLRSVRGRGARRLSRPRCHASPPRISGAAWAPCGTA